MQAFNPAPKDAIEKDKTKEKFYRLCNEQKQLRHDNDHDDKPDIDGTSAYSGNSETDGNRNERVGKKPTFFEGRSETPHESAIAKKSYHQGIDVIL